jgi:polysaccharide export outer membrane protein
MGWIPFGVLLWAASFLGGPQDVQAQYVIGPGDVLRVTVLGNRELDMDVAVQPDGKVSVPLVGDVPAGGMTAHDFSEKLQTEMAKIVRNPIVSVSVKEINSLQIRVLGQVRNPGVYKVLGRISVLQALALAGGPGEFADLSQCYILRKDEKIPTNLDRLLKQADLSQEVPVVPGDTLVIGATQGLGNSVYVFGEVRRPGLQPLTKDLTVLRALINAGGFTTFASLKNVSIIRGPDDKKEKIPVNVKVLLDDPEKGKDIPLQPGDVVYVPEGFF